MLEVENSYTSFVGKLKVKNHLGDQSVDGRILCLKWGLGKGVKS
jgi:hypothetical protein